MQIWPREFWRNPHLFCTTSTSTFGRVWWDPARAALKPKAATSCFQRSAPPSWISNAWHWIHMSNSGRNAKEKSWPGIASPQISFLNLGSFTNKTSLEAKMNTKWLFFPFPASCWDILQVVGFMNLTHWHLRASEILSFGVSEVWSTYVLMFFLFVLHKRYQVRAARHYWVYWIHIC